VEILIAIVVAFFGGQCAGTGVHYLKYSQDKKVQHFLESVFLPSGVVARGDKNKAILW